MNRKRIVPVLLAAVLTLSGCASQAPAPTTAPAASEAVPAVPALIIPETTEAPVETTEAPIETTAPTEPAPTGLPEMEGFINANIHFSKKGSPRMEWDPVPDAASYEISHSLYPDQGFTPLASRGNFYYTNTSAAKGMTHYYQIRALDAYGNQLDTSPILSIELPFHYWESKTANYVAVPKVKIHTHPDSDSPEISLRYMDELRMGKEIITRESGSWFRVYYQDTLYYLLQKADSQDLTTVKSQFAYTPMNTMQKNVLDLALDIANNWNTTYVPGGTGDVNEAGAYQFDCSGLVTYILNNAMQQSVPTYRLSSSMSRLAETDIVYNAGYPGEFRAMDVALEDIQPGDVLFFRSQLDLVPSEELGHCSVYLGNNEFVHCTSVWEDAVCIMPLTGDFRDNLLAVRRYIPEVPTPAETVKVINGPYRHYKIYSEKNSDSEVVAEPCQGDALTVLYTNNDNWAYVRTMSNLYGWFLLQHFGDAPQS